MPYVGPVSRAVLLRDNVLVLSTVTIRRSLVTGGFREERELAAIEDYCLWLDLADAGARIVATPDLVAIYDDTGPDRLSDAVTAVQMRLARHVVRRWRRRLADRDAAVAAAVHTSRAAKLRARELLRR